MPRVSAPARQTVLSEPLPSPTIVRPDVSSGEEALARGAGQVADVAGRIAEDTFQKQQRAQLEDAYTQLGKTRQDILSTARQQHGRDALETDLVAQSEQLLGNAADKIAETLPERTRPDFARIRRQHELGLHDSLVDHVDREAETYRVQQYKGSVAVSADLGVQDAVAARPGAASFAPALGEARKSILSAVAEHTRTWPPEAAQAEKTAQLTGLHAGVVEALARGGRAPEAVGYLNMARAEMDPVTAAKLDKELAGPAQVANAVAVVQGIEAQHPNDEKAQSDAVLALQGALGEKALQVYRERQNMRENALKDLEKARFGRVTDVIEKGGAKTQSQLEGLLEFSQLSDEDKPRARKYLEDNLRAERTIAAAERAAQIHADESVRREYLALTVEERAKLNVKAEYAGRVSKDGLNLLLSDQQKAAKEWNKDQGVGEKEFRGFVVDQVRGVLTKKRDVDDFLAAMGRDRQAWLEDPKNAGKEPGRDQVKKWIVDELTVGKDADGVSWLQFNRPRYRMPRDEKFTAAPQADQDFVRQLGLTPQPAAGAPAAQPTAPPAAPAPSGAPGISDLDRRRVTDRWPKGLPPPSDDQIRAVLVRERALQGGSQ